MSQDIINAINFLKENGFLVIKRNDEINKSEYVCKLLAGEGEHLDCSGCNCNVCIISNSL